MTDIAQAIQHKIDFKTKPLGALGQLESLALQIGSYQNTLSPKLTNPNIIVFAGDHGLAKAGVSAYPQEVTHQMVLNFLGKGAAINVFCEQNQINLSVVDAGVNHDFKQIEGLIDQKINFGTQNMLETAAMTRDELEASLAKGGQVVSQIAKNGCNIIGFGEMGIGNTSAASLLMSAICQLPIEECVGRGTGLDDDQLSKKINILKAVQAKHQAVDAPKDILMTFGGFEIAQICGAMLKAFDLNMLIMVDGFIASAAYLVAVSINPEIKKAAIFCHLSNESGHLNLLNYLDAKPLLKLGMRLGEGTGCAVAYPLIQASVSFLNNMASFESAGVSNKE